MYLENQGYVVMRFPESVIVYRIDEVITDIDYAIQCLEQKIEDKKLNNTQKFTVSNPPLIPPLKKTGALSIEICVKGGRALNKVG